MEISSSSVTQTLNFAKRLARNLQKGDILCLYGQLGSGKTVFTRGIARGLGVTSEKITSPTFVLINQYDCGRIPLYHFDLYRLSLSQDILFLGYEEYLYGQGVSVIEWPQRLDYLLPKEFLRIELKIRSETERLIKIQPKGRRYEELAGLLSHKGGKLK